MSGQIQNFAVSLAARGKGIIAGPETMSALRPRFDALDIEPTADSRRIYREMPLTCPGGAEFISGLTMGDAVARQNPGQSASRMGVLYGTRR